MEKTKYEVKRIGVFSAVKTLFVLGGFSGFILGLVQWAFLRSLWWAVVDSQLQPGLVDEPAVADALNGFMGAAGLILPFFDAILGAVMGVLGAFLLTAIYNLGARIWGGLEFELAPTSVTVQPLPLAPARPGEATPLPGTASQPAPVPPPTRRNDNEPPERPSAAMFE